MTRRRILLTNMKITNRLGALSRALACTAIALQVSVLQGADDMDVRQPKLDIEGRFWVYRNGPAHPPMPFSPYGWMSDATNLAEIIRVELTCRDHPNKEPKAAQPETEQCIRIKVDWKDATWISVGFISGPDKPPWWGETNRGRYFNLGNLAKRKLIFFARGEKGGETIKAQIGMLGDKPFGDSTPSPIVTDEIKLNRDWERHEIDLKDVPPANLARICNGFGVIAERAGQPASSTETSFYIDTVYFE